MSGTFITQCREPNSKFETKVLSTFKEGSKGKRSATVTSISMVAGIGWLSTPSKMAVLYLVRLAEKEGESEMVFLGTTSNDATQLRPSFVTQDVLANVLCIVNKASVPKGIPMGTTIDKKEAALVTLLCDSSGNPKDDEEKVIVRVPVGFPVSYGAQLRTGNINEETFQCLETMDPSESVSWQIETLKRHDKDVQTLLLSSSDLKKYLPSTPSPRGYGTIPSPFIKPNPVGDDDEKLNEDVDNLSDELKEFLDRRIQSLAPHMVQGTPQKSNQRRESLMEIDSPMKEKDENTEAEQAALRTLAYGAVYDHETKRVTVPHLNSLFMAVNEMKKKANQREKTASTLNSLQATLAKGTHYVARMVDLPKMDVITLGFISQGRVSTEPPEMLTDTQANGFNLLQLLPDSASAAKAKKVKESTANKEEVLDEHFSKRTKLNTEYCTVSELNGMSFLQAGLGNLTAVNLFYFNFDLSGMTSKPSIAAYMLDLNETITTLKARRWLKQNADKRVKFIFYVVNQVNAIMACFGQAQQDVLVLNAIKEEEDIPSENYEMAHQVLVDTKNVISRIFLNSTEIPETNLYTTSEQYRKAEEKKTKKLLSELKSSNSGNDGSGNNNRNNGRRQSVAGNRNNNATATNGTTGNGGGSGGGGNSANTNTYKSPDQLGVGNGNEGYIESNLERLNFPPELHNNGFKLCKSSIRNGQKCSFGDRCNFLHTDKIEDLPQDKQKSLVKWVDDTEGVTFKGVQDSVLTKIRSS